MNSQMKHNDFSYPNLYSAMPYSDTQSLQSSNSSLSLSNPESKLSRSPQCVSETAKFPTSHGVKGQQPAGTSNPIVSVPRSASEAQFDNTQKFRQLPCRTFTSVGTCPYRERCVYLHDPRCICRNAKTKTRRKNEDDVELDSLFWPVMPYSMVSTKVDSSKKPHVIQSYHVPAPQNDQFRRHDQAVYSMWMHFVDYCVATSESSNCSNIDSAPCYSSPDLPVNPYTKQYRLPIFRALSASNGKSLTEEDIAKHSFPQNLAKPTEESNKMSQQSYGAPTKQFLHTHNNYNNHFKGKKAFIPHDNNNQDNFERESLTSNEESSSSRHSNSFDNMEDMHRNEMNCSSPDAPSLYWNNSYNRPQDVQLRTKMPSSSPFVGINNINDQYSAAFRF